MSSSSSSSNTNSNNNRHTYDEQLPAEQNKEQAQKYNTKTRPSTGRKKEMMRLLQTFQRLQQCEEFL